VAFVAELRTQRDYGEPGSPQPGLLLKISGAYSTVDPLGI